MLQPTITDYANAIKTPQLVKASRLVGGSPVLKNNKLIKYSGGFCVVFPFQTSNRKYAVRCWHASISDAKNKTKIIANSIQKASLPYFVNFEYVDEGIATSQGVQPLVIMDWVEAMSLKQYIKHHLHNPQVLNSLAESFRKMVVELHRHNMAHGDLQHGNIMVRDDGSLVLVDYDSMYVPDFNMAEDDIKGLLGYQHPARWNNPYRSPKVDYFSELVIYTSIKALELNPKLWDELNMEDSDTLLFASEDISSPNSSSTFKYLANENELKHLADKLLEFLSKSTIEELQPLETILITPADSISSKWKKGNGYVPPQPQNVKEVAKGIINKWGSKL